MIFKTIFHEINIAENNIDSRFRIKSGDSFISAIAYCQMIKTLENVSLSIKYLPFLCRHSENIDISFEILSNHSNFNSRLNLLERKNGNVLKSGNKTANINVTSAQLQLRWATMPEQSGPKSGGGAAVSFSVGELSPRLTQRRLISSSIKLFWPQ